MTGHDPSRRVGSAHHPDSKRWAEPTLRRVRPAWAVLAMALAGCGSLSTSRREAMTFEESAIFHPSRYPDGDWEPRGAAFEDAWFESADGVRVHGWYAGAKDPRAVVLFAHGNAGNLTHRRWVLELFRERLGVSVLVFDYRGYGRSAGTPNERGILADARAARRWLAEREGIGEKDVVLAGESLGGGVAVDLAAKDGARGLVLMNTFSSLPDVAASHFRLLPARLLMTNRLDSRSKIAAYRGPLLQTHGDADRVVPYALGRRLFEAANEPKRFVAVPGGDHNDPPSRDFLGALDRFLDDLRAAGSASRRGGGPT